uniref:Hypothetical glycine-rich secreted protein 976 n=1 Tax=Amblyomma variegatum TaxID=34610 RepID=F0JAA5_AMBVA|nr:TPA_inf: hypothetical glycine-rich secreted protein 976 [Amblyomma variegatum]
MGAVLLWTAALSATMAQYTLVHSQSLFPTAPWDSYDAYYSGLWPDSYSTFWSPQQENIFGDLIASGLYQKPGGVEGEGAASKGGGGGRSSRFGGDYGFPRYGGSSRMSRYGIDYGSRNNYDYGSGGGSRFSRFGGDYGFPRYGGSSRMSRYGIDYGSLDNYDGSSGSYGGAGSYPIYTH